MTLGIVILNFLAYKDTIECVQSIEKQTFQDYQIVIVDNASTNESYKELQTEFRKDNKVFVIKTEENVGFAKGNNIGIAFLKERNIYNILVINGDTLMVQEDYLEQLASLKLADDIAMIGGRIMSRDSQNQNTLPVSLLEKKNLIKNRIELFLLKNSYRLRINNILLKIKKNKPRKDKINEEISRTLDPSKRMLHGAAIYFTENYLKENIGFYPETFLYYEEEFLALICRKLGYKQAYIDELEILHKEDASSNMLMGNDQRKSVLFKIGIIKKNIILMDEALQMSQNEMKKKIHS